MRSFAEDFHTVIYQKREVSIKMPKAFKLIITVVVLLSLIYMYNLNLITQSNITDNIHDKEINNELESEIICETQEDQVYVDQHDIESFNDELLNENIDSTLADLLNASKSNKTNPNIYKQQKLNNLENIYKKGDIPIDIKESLSILPDILLGEGMLELHLFKDFPSVLIDNVSIIQGDLQLRIKGIDGNKYRVDLINLERNKLRYTEWFEGECGVWYCYEKDFPETIQLDDIVVVLNVI